MGSRSVYILSWFPQLLLYPCQCEIYVLSNPFYTTSCGPPGCNLADSRINCKSPPKTGTTTLYRLEKIARQRYLSSEAGREKQPRGGLAARSTRSPHIPRSLVLALHLNHVHCGVEIEKTKHKIGRGPRPSILQHFVVWRFTYSRFTPYTLSLLINHYNKRQHDIRKIHRSPNTCRLRRQVIHNLSSSRWS